MLDSIRVKILTLGRRLLQSPFLKGLWESACHRRRDTAPQPHPMASLLARSILYISFSFYSMQNNYSDTLRYISRKGNFTTKKEYFLDFDCTIRQIEVSILFQKKKILLKRFLKILDRNEKNIDRTPKISKYGNPCMFYRKSTFSSLDQMKTQLKIHHSTGENKLNRIMSFIFKNN